MTIGPKKTLLRIACDPIFSTLLLELHEPKFAVTWPDPTWLPLDWVSCPAKSLPISFVNMTYRLQLGSEISTRGNSSSMLSRPTVR